MKDAFAGLSAIGQIAVTVKEVEPAVVFYRDLLGIKLLFQFPNMAFFDCGGVRLMLSAPEEPGEHHSSIIYFKVEDIGRVHAALSGRGVAFEREPHVIARMPDHDLRMAFFRDLDGNLLALMSEVKKG